MKNPSSASHHNRRPLRGPRNFVSGILLVFLTALSFSSAHVFAQSSNPVSQPWGAQLFTDQATTEFLPVEEAYRLNITETDDQQLQISWEIAPQYYLYQHQLKARWEGSGEQVELQLPAGQYKYDEIFEKELEVYYGWLQYQIPKQIGTLVLHSQGCADAGLCYPPQSHYFEVSNTGIQAIEPLLPKATEQTQGQNNAIDNSSSLTLLGSLLGALLGGLILNLMPCVFPVLSLKALHLMQSHQAPKQQHLHGWAYTLGCVITFSLIAIIMFALRDAGQWIGWGFQLQSPWVVASLAYLFVIMGLILLADYPIAQGLTGTGQRLTQGSGYRASFFTGALATVVASPCTAPFMGAALGYAITQPTAVGTLIFACLGLGMALPFLALSYFPALARQLPKPGPWMNTLKQFFAFPLFFTALWLLWVLGKQSGSDAVIAFAGGSIAIALGLWLWHSTPHSKLKRSLALLTIVGALLPYQWSNTTAPTQTSQQQALDHNWQPFTQERLQQLVDSGTPTFVNMTAAWCITCLANEKIALNTDASLAAFEDLGIVKLKGDWTNYNPEITKTLNQFGRNGVPLYLLYSGNTGEKPLILPQLLTEDLLIEALNRTL